MPGALSRLALLLALLVPLGGCASLVDRAGRDLASDLELAVRNQPDAGIVREALPAYLLLLDSRIAAAPDKAANRLAAARLYAAYAANFVEEPVRAASLSTHAKMHAEQALCLHSEALCEALKGSAAEFPLALAKTTTADLAFLYGYATAITTWVQQHSQDWLAVAELPRAEQALRRVVELDPAHEKGNAHVYLGVLGMRLPATLGGKPDQSRAHFEAALAIHNSLMTRALFARHYARGVYDQTLHDALVQEVLQAPVDLNGEQLINEMAKQMAQELAAGASAHF